jgi:hypothetical protein
MTDPATGGTSPAPLSDRITLDCPKASASVPAKFSASGTYTLSFGGPTVKCVVSYTNAGGNPKSQCKVCVLDTTKGLWCCQFDLSADPPNADPVKLTATLYDSLGTVLDSQSTDVVYKSGATDPCSCSGAGTPC